jgi:type II secretory pathway component PulF
MEDNRLERDPDRGALHPCVGLAWREKAAWRLVPFVLAGLAWGALVGVVPTFARFFHETGVALHPVTEWLVAASRFATSPSGHGVFTLGLVAALAVEVRLRHRPAVRDVLTTWSAMGLLGLLVMMVWAILFAQWPGLLQKL